MSDIIISYNGGVFMPDGCQDKFKKIPFAF